MNQERLMKVIVAPVVSEKSNDLAENKEQIVLKVKRTATKREIKAAVELLFEVKVQAVNTVNQMGKNKRFGRYEGKRSDVKKAYVTLVPGQNLDVEATTSKSAE
ncbi:MAG: 50S ribosomal protein L23 [Neisseriaceae bacterium]|nr:50S ribosomal protein L23 [Neisseriaceae bacterium PsAf]MCV2503858.1 50S ribosomal protein L23 [Neisseriaceae bacterium]MCV2509150.1 50S ribosomal protein L23 [Neisseriaceae bacterium]